MFGDNEDEVDKTRTLVSNLTFNDGPTRNSRTQFANTATQGLVILIVKCAPRTMPILVPESIALS